MTVNFDASGCDFGPDFTIDTIREGGVNTWFVSASRTPFCSQFGWLDQSPSVEAGLLSQGER